VHEKDEIQVEEEGDFGAMNTICIIDRFWREIERLEVW
jgi:hypothetical protein